MTSSRTRRTKNKDVKRAVHQKNTGRTKNDVVKNEARRKSMTPNQGSTKNEVYKNQDRRQRSFSRKKTKTSVRRTRKAGKTRPTPLNYVRGPRIGRSLSRRVHPNHAPAARSDAVGACGRTSGTSAACHVDDGASHSKPSQNQKIS